MPKKHFEPDILHGSLWKNIPLFAIPVAATSAAHCGEEFA